MLGILVQSRRNAKAARRFFRKLLRGLQYVPRVIVTDKLKSCSAAKREILPGIASIQSCGVHYAANATASSPSAGRKPG